MNTKCDFFDRLQDVTPDLKRTETILSEDLMTMLESALVAILKEIDRQKEKSDVMLPIRVNQIRHAEDNPDIGIILYIAIGPGVGNLELIQKHNCIDSFNPQNN